MIRVALESDRKDIESFDPFPGDRGLHICEGRVIVSESEEGISGYISLSRDGLLGRPYVQYLAVRRISRRAGVASRLLKQIELQHRGKRLFISTESTNEIMQAFLEKHRYLRAGNISAANRNGSDELYYYKDIDPE